MLGAFRARVAPFNVNYRYVEEELVYLFAIPARAAVVYHAELRADARRGAAPPLPELEVLLQVEDDSGNALLPGAHRVRGGAGRGLAREPAVEPSPDDLYILYTGGTTGMPKGVLWRQADIHSGAMGGRKRDGKEIESLEEASRREDRHDGPLAVGAAAHARRGPMGVVQRCWHGRHGGHPGRAQRLDPHTS